MFNITNVKKDFAKIRFGDPFQEYSRVEMNLSDEDYRASGEKTGRTLVFDCPLISDWLDKDLDPENGIENPASDKVVENVRNQVLGFVYQPYNASCVMIEPAVELGDGIFINNIYSGIYSMDVKFSKTEAYISDISAPNEEEIDHEFPYEPQTERKINRRIRNAEATLKVQTDEISAKVSKTGENEDKTFEWRLTDNAWRLYSNGNLILRVNKDGLWVNGDGKFTGEVYAGNIKANDTVGYVARDVLARGVRTSLNWADTAGEMFKGMRAVGNIMTGRLKVTGTVELLGYKWGIKTAYINGETIYYLGIIEEA